MEHIHPIQPIALIILAIVFWYMRKKKLAAKGPASGGKDGQSRPGIQRPAKQADPPEVIYAGLRKKAFMTSPQNLGPAGDVKEDEAYGAVMEMGISDSVLTLACFADGDAGLYYQSGGGVKGGGAHENVRKAAKDFVALTQKVIPRMTKASRDQTLPESGKVSFYALTPKGLLTTQVDREALGETHPLAPLFYAGQEVVGQMRQVQAEKAS